MSDAWRMVRRTKSAAVDIAVDKSRIVHRRIAGCRRGPSVDALVRCCRCW